MDGRNEGEMGAWNRGRMDGRSRDRSRNTDRGRGIYKNWNIGLLSKEISIYGNKVKLND